MTIAKKADLMGIHRRDHHFSPIHIFYAHVNNLSSRL